MDDLVNLDWSSKPLPPTNGAKSAVGGTVLRPPAAAAASSFDFLTTTASGGGPSYYSSTPLRAATPTLAPLKPSISGNARLASTLPARNTPVPNSSGKTATATPGSLTSGDAFSDLLSLGPSSSINNKQLSLADRQAKLAKEKEDREEREKHQFAGDGQFWERFGGESQPGPSRTPTIALPSNMKVPVTISQPNPVKTNGMGSFWNDNDLLSPSVSQVPTKSSTPLQKSVVPRTAVLDPFDFEALSASVGQLSSKASRNGNNSSTGTSEMRTPVSDFDFGEADLASMNEEDDDILGLLGRPAVVTREAASVKPKQVREAATAPQSRSASPPPHIIGQIVEMGYSPAQARAALAKTKSGRDVEAAVEIILGQTSSRDDEDDFPEVDEDQVEIERRRKEEEAERRRKRRAGPSRESVKARSEPKEDQYAEQKEMILEKAGEIKQWGLSTATSLWNSGRKLLEEQRKALEASELAKKAKGPASSSRPRWAADAAISDDDEKGTEGSAGFKDIVDRNTAGRQNGHRTTTRDRQERPDPGMAPRNGKIQESLFGDDEPIASGSRQSLQPPTRTKARSPPAQLPKRTLITATPSQLQTSRSKKALGNEHFKLGRFTEAEQSYSSAISALPTGHLFLVPLFNNRCASRLKLGNSAGAAEDATMVIELVGAGYHPNREAALPPEIALEVKLSDAVVKATTKRAQAWEMSEKWSSALEDWERLLGFDAVILGTSASGTRTLASEGARRARKALEPKVQISKAPVQAKAKTMSRPANTDKSQAVAELRKANQAAEAEDAERFAAKDTVDSKLSAWKTGKETNLRALIASLDMVLWEDIMKGGLKVGMHELITEKQVKIKYMKVIARLHPDKLNITNTTIEQRMLANGAFGALNEAWQAFNA